MACARLAESGASGRQAGDPVRVSGCKRFVRPAQGASGWIVAAELDDDTALCWLEADAPGLQLRQETGVDGLSTATLQMDEAPARLLATGLQAHQALVEANGWHELGFWER